MGEKGKRKAERKLFLPSLLGGSPRRAADGRGRGLDRRLPGRGRGLFIFFVRRREEKRERERGGSEGGEKRGKAFSTSSGEKSSREGVTEKKKKAREPAQFLSRSLSLSSFPPPTTHLLDRRRLVKLGGSDARPVAYYLERKRGH